MISSIINARVIPNMRPALSHQWPLADHSFTRVAKPSQEAIEVTLLISPLEKIRLPALQNLLPPTSVLSQSHI